jgi:RNA polymerase sigma-70 factor (ECF subfamily)
LTTLTAQTREETRLRELREQIDDFDQIVARHQAEVARLAYRLLGWRDREAVDDVVQEVFLVALTRLKNFRGDSSLATWLMGITVNQCRAHRRRSTLRLTWLRQRWTGTSATEQPPAANDGDETSRQVRDAVAALPSRDREVIVLFYLEDFSVAQIAQLLGLKNNAVEVRLHRARQRLRTKLAGLLGE